MTTFSKDKIERLIRISKANPQLPDSFIPWEVPLSPKDQFIPEYLISLYGHEAYQKLQPEQKRELGKHEIVQVMYSYAWSETLACLFFTRHLLTLNSTSTEYRFLLRETIEEFQHQEMFSRIIMKMDGQPLRAKWLHRSIGKITAKYFPSSLVFMSVLAVEMVADTYGRLLRQDDSVQITLRKVSELHNIEEGRHIHYNKMWLNRFTQKAGFFKRTLYSLTVLGNIYFMRTLYVRKEIFERIGCENPRKIYRQAKRNYAKLFAQHCLGEAIDFVKEIKGFNFITRPLWRWMLKAKV